MSGRVERLGDLPLKLVTARSPSVREEWKEAPVGAASKDHRPRKAMSLSSIVCELKLTLVYMPIKGYIKDKNVRAHCETRNQRSPT